MAITYLYIDAVCKSSSQEALLSLKLIVGDYISDPIRLSGPAKGELVSGFSPVSGRLSSIDMNTHQLWLGACHHEYIGMDREGCLTTSRVMLILHSPSSYTHTANIVTFYAVRA